MASKLVYTSTSKGLIPGAYGFCVVACSRGLSEQTSRALETLSGYRRLELSGAEIKPVVFSHVVLNLGSASRHVLSRVADAGLDYSNRQNKIACHYVLDDRRDFVVAGPTSVLNSPDLFEKTWQGAPVWYETPIFFPPTPPRGSSCFEWKRVMGDAGWAGALASTALSGRPVVLLVRPEDDVLKLFDEATSLLTPDQRWNVTFSTYFTKNLPNVTCQWKATFPEVVDGTFSRAPNAVTFDLTTRRCSQSLAEFASQSTEYAELIDRARYSILPPAPPKRVIPVPPALPNAAVANETLMETPVDATTSEIEDDVQVEETTEPDKSAVKPPKIKRLNYGRGMKLPKDENRVDENIWFYLSLGLVFLIAIAIFVGVRLVKSGYWKELANSSAQPPAEATDLGSKDAPLQEKEAENRSERQDHKKEATQKSSDETDDPFQFEDEPEPRSNDEEDDPFDFDDETQNTRSQDQEDDPFDFGDDMESETSDRSGDASQDVDGMRDEQNKDRHTDSSSRFTKDQETVKRFLDSVNSGETAVDFSLFDSYARNRNNLTDVLSGKAQSNLSDVYSLCAERGGKIEIECDLTEDVESIGRFLDSRGGRTKTKSIDFSSYGVSADNQIVRFEIVTRDKPGKETNGSFELQFTRDRDSSGNLTYVVSDEKTRGYLLSVGKLRWRFHVPSRQDEEGFDASSRAVQLLRPCDFQYSEKVDLSYWDFLFSGVNASRPPLSDQTKFRTWRNKNLYALVVCFDSDPSLNFKCDPIYLDSSVDFIFRSKYEDYDAFTVRFTRNGNVVRFEKLVDLETVSEAIESYYFNKRRSKDPYVNSNDVNEVYDSTEHKIKNAKQSFKTAFDSDLTFSFYLVPKNAKGKTNATWIKIGTVVVNSNTDVRTPDDRRK